MVESIIFSLSSFDPLRVLRFKWSYSWSEIKQFYIQKSQEQAERANQFCEFLVELTSAALGGGRKNKDEVGLDTGEGSEEMTDEQMKIMVATLGEECFQQIYPHLRG